MIDTNEAGDVIMRTVDQVDAPPAENTPPPPPVNAISEQIVFNWSSADDADLKTTLSMTFPHRIPIQIVQGPSRENPDVIALTLEEAKWLNARLGDAISATQAYLAEQRA